MRAPHCTALVLVLVAAAAAAVGCGPPPPPEEQEIPKGSATLRFAIADDIRDSPSLDAELRGNIYGALFLSADVNIFGPIDGAEEFGSITMEDVDLREVGSVTATSFVSEELTANTYSFLGFFDIDANDADDKDPDSGDPCTFPGTTDFDIAGGENTEYTLEFTLVR